MRAVFSFATCFLNVSSFRDGSHAQRTTVIEVIAIASWNINRGENTRSYPYGRCSPVRAPRRTRSSGKGVSGRGKPERGRASERVDNRGVTPGRLVARRPRYPGIDHTGHGRRLTRSAWLPTGRYRRLPLTVTPPVRHTRVTSLGWTDTRCRRRVAEKPTRSAYTRRSAVTGVIRPRGSERKTARRRSSSRLRRPRARFPREPCRPRQTDRKSCIHARRRRAKHFQRRSVPKSHCAARLRIKVIVARPNVGVCETCVLHTSKRKSSEQRIRRDHVYCRDLFAGTLKFRRSPIIVSRNLNQIINTREITRPAIYT